MLVHAGELAAAERVLGRLGIGLDDEAGRLADRWEATPCLEVLIRARILCARGQPERALKDLRRLRNLAVKAGRIRLSIEILTVMAVAEFDRNAHAAVGKNVLAAVSLSPSSGFVRIFLDEGQRVPAIMKWVQDHCREALRDLVEHQLQAILAAASMTAADPGLASEAAPGPQGLVEELSVRELEVLELIVSGHSNGQIGKQLDIAESTVKWHAKNIFGKLGVKNRTSAALAAQQLKLFGNRPLL
jgi:LuxR family maltose regulon positive regulatory protein